MSEASQRRSRGRPADPDIDARVLQAGLELFAEVGWKAFNLDGVARRARVGKAALYRRWPSKEKLILDALEQLALPAVEFDTGSLRGDLLELGSYILSVNLSATGLTGLRAAIEAKRDPGVFGDRLERMVREQVTIGRNMIGRAVERGEVPAGTSSWLVFNALMGTIQNRVLMTPADKLPALEKEADALVETVVDFLLAAVRYTPRTTP